MEDNLCYVCYESEMTETLPCSHKLCGHCYELLNKCPMCRAPYHEDEEMYHDIEDDDDYDYVDEAPFFGFLIDFFALSLVALWLKFCLTLYINVSPSSSVLLL